MAEPPDLPLSPDDVVAIVALLDGSDYDRLEITTPRFTLKIARSEAGGWTQDWRHTGATLAVAATLAESSAPARLSPPDESCVVSPLPGRFYHAPQPGAPSFVQVGDWVGADTIIGIVETMKVMNSIPAARSGIIREFLVPNGEMVAAGTALLRLDIAA